MYLRPHLKPTGRFSMLQRLGMVMAIWGLIPDALAVLESKTAQRQLGFWPIFFTSAQQLSETGAFSSCAAIAQGASIIASASGDDFPHSPAASRPAMLSTTTSSPSRQMNFTDTAILVSHKAQILDKLQSQNAQAISQWGVFILAHEL